jgi:cytochrome b561
MVALPLSGYLGSTFSGYPIRYFGLTLPNWGGKDEELKELLSTVHWTAAWLLVLLIGLHVAAALRHRLARDGLFERMWPVGRSAARPSITGR